MQQSHKYRPLDDGPHGCGMLSDTDEDLDQREGKGGKGWRVSGSSPSKCDLSVKLSGISCTETVLHVLLKCISSTDCSTRRRLDGLFHAVGQQLVVRFDIPSPSNLVGILRFLGSTALFCVCVGLRVLSGCAHNCYYGAHAGHVTKCPWSPHF